MGGLSVPVIRSIPRYAFNQLVEQITEFQDALSDDHEVGIVANGAGLTIHVEKMLFSGQMVVFDGTDASGHPARLIQHFTQVNVQMITVEKLQPEPKRIGFQFPDHDAE